MAFFNVAPTEKVNTLTETFDRGFNTSVRESESTPGFFEGDILGAVGSGVKAGVNRSKYNLYADSVPEEANRKKEIVESIRKMRPDPKTLGMFGSAVQDLTEMATFFGTEYLQDPIANTLSAPVFAMNVTKNYEGAQTAINMDDGMDAKTASDVSRTASTAMGIGAMIPVSVAGSFLTRFASGGAMNVAVGAGERAETGRILRSAGYEDMAKQYSAMDGQAAMAEFVLGGMFGGLFGARARVRATPDKILPSHIDGALAANQSVNASVDLAPGVPVDGRSAQAHSAAMNSAIEQLAFGEKVNVENLLTEAGFLGKRPDFNAVSIIREELAKAGFDDVAAKVRDLETAAQSRGLYVEPSDLNVVLSDAPADIKVGGARGRDDKVKIGNEYVPYEYRVMESSDVSGTLNKADNQYRDRTRVASEQQIAQVAADLDPRLLVDASPVMDYGAPVMTADGKIIAGNGRAAFIERAYETNGGQSYRDYLRENSEALGLNAAEIDGMQRPVLVRVLQRDVDVNKAAILSNEGGAMGMSALEQAKVDGERLGDFGAFQFGEDGSVNMAANADFIRSWVREFPTNQISRLMDADGRLSAEGNRRLQNAIMYRAYGDSDTLARLIEATDVGSRNIVAALSKTAARVADAKESIARGELYPLDLSEDLLSAVEKIDSINRSGQTVKEWVAQLDAFGDGMTGEARALVVMLDKNIRSSRAISDAIDGYYSRLEALGNPEQGSIFEAATPTKQDVFAPMLDGEVMYSRDASPLFKNLAENDEIFQYPRSDKSDMQAVFDDVVPGLVKSELSIAPDGIDEQYKVYPVKAGNVLRDQEGTINVYPDGKVEINVLNWKEGSGGSGVYSAVGNWALNNGKQFAGDRDGISAAGKMRRLENIISLALKFKTTDHISPHPDQMRELGFDWREGDTNYNIAQMMEASYNAIRNGVYVTENRFGVEATYKSPNAVGVDKLDDLVYSFSEQRFIDESTGKEYTDADFDKLAKTNEARGVAAGRTTLKRAALAHTFVRQESGAGAQRLLEQSRRVAYQSLLDTPLEGVFYSRMGGAKSTVSDLTATFQAQFGRDASRLIEQSRVKIVQSVTDLPARNDATPHPADVGGMYDPRDGMTYIVADNTEPSQVRGRILHEIGVHAGFETILGDAMYADVLAHVDAKIAAGDERFIKARALAEKNAARPEHVPQETLAYLVENAPESSFGRRILAAVRQWLYRVTGGRFVDLSVGDLVEMASASLRRQARIEGVALGNDMPMYQIAPERVRELQYETKIPDSPEFREAVANTEGASITDDGLLIDLVRFQKDEQGGAESVRTGVFYLPAGSPNAKHYRVGGTAGHWYGGSEKMTGQTVVKAPLFVKGATGGKAPEAAYDAIMGKGASKKLNSEARSAALTTKSVREEVVYRFLEENGADPEMAWSIIENSQQGNQLTYALQENVIAHAVREAGYDSVVGYSKGKAGLSISEVFDVRETSYPARGYDSEIHPDFSLYSRARDTEDFYRNENNGVILSSNDNPLPTTMIPTGDIMEPIGLAEAKADANIQSADAMQPGFLSAVECALVAGE